MTVLDLTLLLAHFPPDAEIAQVGQMPGTDAILLRVDLPDPKRRPRATTADWFDDEITEIDLRRSRVG